MPNKKKGRKRRFFFHYNKRARCMTVHFADTCHLATNGIQCYVPCESKVRRTQPHIVMQGWATEVRIKNGEAQII